MSKNFTLYRGIDRRFVPWKNGGGQTAEIVCQPQGAAMDDFSWRISTAHVTQSGLFSHFPGVTRCLAVIEGGQLELHLPDQTLALRPNSDPVRFSGELPCNCILTGTDVLDLNLMTRAPFFGSIRYAGTPQAHLGELVARYVFKHTAAPDHGLTERDLLDVSRMAFLDVEVYLGSNDLILEVFR